MMGSFLHSSNQRLSGKFVSLTHPKTSSGPRSKTFLTRLTNPRLTWTVKCHLQKSLTYPKRLTNRRSSIAAADFTESNRASSLTGENFGEVQKQTKNALYLNRVLCTSKHQTESNGFWALESTHPPKIVYYQLAPEVFRLYLVLLIAGQFFARRRTPALLRVLCSS